MIETMKILARQAGEAIATIYHENLDLEVEYKHDDSPLTKADLASHKIIVEGLKNKFPDIPIISEEEPVPEFTIRKEWKEYFLIDPLDGTKEFIKKRKEFTVNIAYIVDHKPVLGTVYAPVLDKLYFCDGEKSYLEHNGKKNALPRQNFSPDEFIVIASKSHLNEETKNYIEKIKNEFPELSFRAAGSSLKLCLIAEGVADLYPRMGPTSEWDTAAAHAVVLGAGGGVMDFETKSELLYNTKDCILNPYFVVYRYETKDLIETSGYNKK